jgi:hypothetical protein
MVCVSERLTKEQLTKAEFSLAKSEVARLAYLPATNLSGISGLGERARAHNAVMVVTSRPDSARRIMLQ